MGYMQAAGLVGSLGTDIWGMTQGGDLFGSKPKIAPWKKIDLGQQQQQAIGANISAMPQISQLGNLYQSYLTQQLNTALPGYSDIMKQGGADTSQELATAGSLLKGDIPPDVAAQVQRNAAFGAMSGGFAGSGMSRNLTARDLGLTSLDLINQGANLAGQGGAAAQRWAGLASGTVMNPSADYVNPQQMFQDTFQNQLQAQATLQNKYNVAAMPNPQTVGDYGILSSRFGALSGMGSGGGGSGGSGGMDLSSLMSMFGGGGASGGGMGMMGGGFGMGM
jgi:hypothetical protein